MQIDDDVFMGGVVALVSGFFAWVIKAAARQAFGNMTQSIDRLTRSVDEHRKELTDVRVELAQFNARLHALENQETEK